MSRRHRFLRTFLHLGVLAAVLAFVAVMASAWSTPIGSKVPRVAAAPGIYLQIGDGGGTFVFSPVMCDQDNIAPSSQCQASLVIRNAGESDSATFSYTVQAWADDDGVDSGAAGPAGDSLVSCFNVNLGLTPADGLNVGDDSSVGPLSGALLEPGDSQTWGIEASVDGDNLCQGATSWIILAVTAAGDSPADPTSTPTQRSRPSSSRTPATSDISDGASDDTGTTSGPDVTPTATETPRVVGGATGTSQPPSAGSPGASSPPMLPVNEIPGVQRLPSTGSGGFTGGSGFDIGPFEAALMVILIGVSLAGFSLLRRGNS